MCLCFVVNVLSWSVLCVANVVTARRYVGVHVVRRYATAHVTARSVTGHVIRSRVARDRQLALPKNKQVGVDTIL